MGTNHSAVNRDACGYSLHLIARTGICLYDSIPVDSSPREVCPILSDFRMARMAYALLVLRLAFGNMVSGKEHHTHTHEEVTYVSCQNHRNQLRVVEKL
jgi:hypothetical protein